MAKIPNWSSVSKRKWRHDENRHVMIEVREMGEDARNPDQPYEVLLFNGRGSDIGDPVRSASTMEEARKQAVEWMRNHPERPFFR